MIQIRVSLLLAVLIPWCSAALWAQMPQVQMQQIQIQQPGGVFPPVSSFLGDPETFNARFMQEMRRCSQLEPTAEVYERIGCLFIQRMNHQAFNQQAEADQVLEQAISLFDQIGDDFGASVFRDLIGEIALAQGRYADAAQQLERSLNRLDKLERSGERVRVGFMTSMTLLWSPQMRDSLKQVAPMMELMGPTFLAMARSRVHQAYGKALVGLGRHEEASEQLELAQEATKRIQMPVQGIPVQGMPSAPLSFPTQPSTPPSQPQQPSQPSPRPSWTPPPSPPSPSPPPSQPSWTPPPTNPPPPSGDGMADFMLPYMHGRAAQMAGDLDAAIQFFEESLEKLAEKGPGLDSGQQDEFKAEVLVKLAEAYTSLGLTKKAMKLLEEARESASEDMKKLIDSAIEQLYATQQSDFSPETNGSGLLGLSMGESGKQAMELLHASIRLYEEERYREALPLLIESQARFRDLGLKEMELNASSLLAGMYLVQGRYQDALLPNLHAIDLLESITRETQVDDLARSLFQKHGQLYPAVIYILKLTGDLDRSFYYSERARSRAFLNQLGNERPEIAQGVDTRLTEELEEVRRRRSGIERDLARQHATSGMEQSSNRHKELRDLRSREEELRLEIEIDRSQQATSAFLEPIDAETLRSQVLDDDVTLVSYFISAQDNMIMTWVVDREDLSEAPSIVFDDLGDTVTQFQTMTYGRDFDEEFAEELYRKLITPVKPYVRHRNLIIVPHGLLHSLPFGALRNPETGRYLVEDYNLAYAPSASALRYLRDKRSPFDAEVLVLGNPEASGRRLLQAENEARAVAEIFGTEPVLGARATESALRRAAGEIDLLHVAAHGIYNDEAPRTSHVLLAEDAENDGRLEVWELFDEVDLHGANLVVLSACNTALGKHVGGDEIIGLTRAFLYAGSPAVVSTLWAIDDAASAKFMRVFYCRLLGGAAPAEALTLAQRELLRSEEFTQPYYWAAFKLTGDHRRTWTGTGLESPVCSGT